MLGVGRHTGAAVPTVYEFTIFFTCGEASTDAARGLQGAYIASRYPSDPSAGRNGSMDGQCVAMEQMALPQTGEEMS